MKAFMSTGADRRTREIDADQMLGVSATLWGEAAEHEARAILAETEPETRYSSTYAPAPYYQPWSGRSERGMMHAALADALRAFVGEE